MEQLKVGDRVTIRTVDEMVESGAFEYNTSIHSVIILNATDITTDFAFNKHMQYLCGEAGVISRIIGGFRMEIEIEFDDPSITLKRPEGGRWYISRGMVKRFKPAVSDEDVTSFLDEF